MIMEKLDSIRAEFPACVAVALADITSQTVFCVSAHRKPPQERIDAMCEAAAQMLDRVGFPQECVVMSENQTLVFLRSPREPTEALLSICTADMDVERFLTQCRAQLNDHAPAQ